MVTHPNVPMTEILKDYTDQFEQCDVQHNQATLIKN